MLNLEECDIFDEKSLFSVFPNPSNGVVELKLNYDENASVQVFDIMGKMIYSFDNHSDNMEEVNACLSNLGEGVYFVKVIVNESNYTSKLIKY